jgi:hypothetical protein
MKKSFNTYLDELREFARKNQAWPEYNSNDELERSLSRFVSSINRRNKTPEELATWNMTLEYVKAQISIKRFSDTIDTVQKLDEFVKIHKCMPSLALMYNGQKMSDEKTNEAKLAFMIKKLWNPHMETIDPVVYSYMKNAIERTNDIIYCRPQKRKRCNDVEVEAADENAAASLLLINRSRKD